MTKRVAPPTHTNERAFPPTHTPGPWEVDNDAGSDFFFIRPKRETRGTDTIARIHHISSARARAVTKANARLIADAPDLHAALHDVAAILNGTEWNADTLDAIAARVRAAGYPIGDVP